MAKSCIIRPPKAPNQSPELFDEIKREVSKQLDNSPKSKRIAYNTTWKLYGLAISSKFREDYKNSLSFNAEGFPTFDSLMNNEYANKILGTELQNKVFESKFPIRENTRDNYSLALESALDFNKQHPTKIAIVETNKDGKIATKVVQRNADTFQQFKEQYAAEQVAKASAQELASLGIEIGDIVGEESKYRNGKVDFTKVRDILDGINSIIMVSNNMQGARAVGEEFSHLIVGTKRNNPLVQRLLNNLSSNEEALRTILGDKYEAEIEAQEGDMSKVAEEALGQMLHRHLIDNQIENTFGQEEIKRNNVSQGFLSGFRNLFNRLRDFILRKFKNKDINTTAKILSDAENAMSEIAKSITDGTLKLTKRDIRRSYSDTILNDLNEQMSRNINILEEAIKIEQKRFTITDDASRKSDITDILNELGSGTRPNADSLLTVFKYLEYATKELGNQNYSLSRFSSLDNKQKFQTLRRIRSYIQSFEPIVNLIYEVSGANDVDVDPNIFDSRFEYNGNTVNVHKQLKDLNAAIGHLKGQYKRLIIPAFAKFLEPFVGKIKANDGSTIDLEEMLKTQTSDISLLDRWLDSMADSNDQLLQSLDTVLRTQKDKARLKSLQDIRKIQALQKKAKEMGITSFDWMFETYKDGNKTGNYISEVNYSQFYKDLKEFNNYLDNKYGKNPSDATTRNQKLADKRTWLNSNAMLDLFGNYIPNSRIYRSTQYDNLTTNQKSILKEYLALKEEFDKNYPTDKVGTGAIQIRKDSTQRYIDMAKSPSTIFSNIKNAWESNWVNQPDDDQMYGERNRSGLMGFDGRQFNMLPILYQNRLNDPNELSTDVFSAMTAYAISSNDYEAVSDVVDALEVGRTLLTDNIRRTEETVGDNPLVETVRVNGEKITQRIIKGKTVAEDKLNEWFDSQVYQKHYAEETEFTIPILNKRISTVKATGVLTSMASTCQLAFNWLANMANVGTGIAMTNIDAVSGEFFNAKNLAAADKEYASLLPSFVKELNSRYQTNKLALFGELFNVKYQFDNRGHKSQRESALARIFGKSIGFMGQDGGDHWLYTRIAIAMAHKEQVQVPQANGSMKTMSLWDALKIENSPEGHGLKQMVLPKGTLNSKGEEFNIGKYSRKIGKVSQRLFGIYNDEDRSAAQRHSLGRLLLMYRQWMKPQFNTRFQAKQYNQTLEAYEEGYYRTIANLLTDLTLGKIKLAGLWSSLEDYEKRNIRRAMAEIVQFVAVMILAHGIEWPDDEDRPWILKWSEYMAKREYHELGNLIPSLVMIRELSATVKSPSAVLSTVDSAASWLSTLLTPSDWDNELESGPWEGHSTLYKKTMKLPIPVLQWYNQIDKFTGGIEDKINYYARIQRQ